MTRALAVRLAWVDLAVLGAVPVGLLLINTDEYFRYRVEEPEIELTVYPFCVEYRDLIADSRWQIFVLPITETTSQYFHCLEPFSKNPLRQFASWFLFNTVIKILAMPEDQKWFKSSFKHWEKGENMHLSENDFGLKQYMKKFFIHAKRS